MPAKFGNFRVQADLRKQRCDFSPEAARRCLFFLGPLRRMSRTSSSILRPCRLARRCSRDLTVPSILRTTNCAIQAFLGDITISKSGRTHNPKPTCENQHPTPAKARRLNCLGRWALRFRSVQTRTSRTSARYAITVPKINRRADLPLKVCGFSVFCATSQSKSDIENNRKS